MVVGDTETIAGFEAPKVSSAQAFGGINFCLILKLMHLFIYCCVQLRTECGIRYSHKNKTYKYKISIIKYVIYEAMMLSY